MILYFASFVLCNLASKINIREFNKTQYDSFRDNLSKNNFLITLVVNSSETVQLYKKNFTDVCNDISTYVNKNVNISYSILIDNDIKNKAIFRVYLPGISEAEVNFNTNMSVSFNSNKILNKCLTLAINLRRLEKSQKSPEVARIKKELREIVKILKILKPDDPKREELLNDYSKLTDELMQYTSEKKQKIKKLKLQLQLHQNESSKSKKIEKKIKKIKKKMSHKKSKSELSQKKLQRIEEKKMINTLKKITDDSYSNTIKVEYKSAKKESLKSNSNKQNEL